MLCFLEAIFHRPGENILKPTNGVNYNKIYRYTHTSMKINMGLKKKSTHFLSIYGEKRGEGTENGTHKF